MPKGFQRPYTRTEKEAVEVRKKTRGSPSAGEEPTGSNWARAKVASNKAKSIKRSGLAIDAGQKEVLERARPEKKPTLKAAAASLKSGWRKGAEKYGLKK